MGYVYEIGSYEVTTTEYAAFLNAIAAVDTNGLYNTQMAGTSCGIVRLGSAGSYTYATVPGRENHPVNFVSYWNACRFANWLHNGQPVGPQNSSTTEDGSYTLTASAMSSNSVMRNHNWQWAVTDNDEWYKAAYYQPASDGGDIDGYWLYPTSSNSISTDQANYGDVIGSTTPVGTYSANYYGAFDMGGNLWELNDLILNPSVRGLRGGSCVDARPDGHNLRSDVSSGAVMSTNDDGRGFRVCHHPGRCKADYNGTSCPGDVLDFLDFIDDFSACEQQSSPCGTLGNPDFNGDTFVDILDFLDFFDAFGMGC